MRAVLGVCLRIEHKVVQTEGYSSFAELWVCFKNTTCQEASQNEPISSPQSIVLVAALKSQALASLLLNMSCCHCKCFQKATAMGREASDTLLAVTHCFWRAELVSHLTECKWGLPLLFASRELSELALRVAVLCSASQLHSVSLVQLTFFLLFLLFLLTLWHPPPPCQPAEADQAVQTTGRHQKLNTHYFNLMLIMC